MELVSKKQADLEANNPELTFVPKISPKNEEILRNSKKHKEFVNTDVVTRMTKEMV
jgi:hypothetical protein